MQRLFTLCCGILLAAPLLADTLVYGTVLAVEPVHEAVAASERRAQLAACEETAPSAGAGLVARLRWDLQTRAVADARCRAATEPDFFRVTFRWNGETFTQELPYDPGDRIPLRLDVR